MPRLPHPDIPRVCAYCHEPWIQRDGKEPRAFCTASCAQAARRASAPPVESEPVSLPPLPTRARRVTATMATLTCAWCGDTVEVEHFPGPLPRYCGDDCRMLAENDRASERMRRMRHRRLLASLTAPLSPPRTGEAKPTVVEQQQQTRLSPAG